MSYQLNMTMKKDTVKVLLMMIVVVKAIRLGHISSVSAYDLIDKTDTANVLNSYELVFVPVLFFGLTIIMIRQF